MSLYHLCRHACALPEPPRRFTSRQFAIVLIALALLPLPAWPLAGYDALKEPLHAIAATEPSAMVGRHNQNAKKGRESREAISCDEWGATPTPADLSAIVEAMSDSSRKDVDMQFLVADGCLDSFILRLGRLSATIKFVDRNVGFLYAAVPRQRLLEALDLRGSQYLSVVKVLDATDPAPPAADFVPGSLPAFRLPITRVDETLPANGPFFPAQEAGLSALWQQFPDADGRGVRIAFVDDGFDLLHPALQQVKGADGLSPKVADVDVAATPTDQPGWVHFENVAALDQPEIRWAGSVWKLPAKGRYGLGAFAVNLTLGSPGNPTAPKVALRAGVLWDHDRDLIWIDTDGDRDFTNNHALRDFASSHDVDFFGRMEGTEDDRIPFAVKIDRVRNAVFVALGRSHGTVVASTAAANRLTGGLFEGAAPQAQIIDVRRSSSTAVPAMIRAASRPDVDVVNRSGAIGVFAGDTGPQEFERQVIKRLVERYKKPIVCVCTVPGTINVGDYQSAQMLERNRQLPPPVPASMNHAAWFNDQGIENSVVAPSVAITAESRYAPYTYLDSLRRSHFGPALLNASAPAGYAIGANPSPTVSLVSGVIADLIGLARQKHVRYDATRMADAVFTGTSLVSGFPGGIQGHGLVNALGAWRQLEAMSNADDPDNPVLTGFEVRRIIDGKISTVYGYSEHFRSASGLQHRELWVTRRGGFPGIRAYKVVLRSNDGTFALSDATLLLERGRPTPIRFTVRPEPGLHVAYLQLIDEEAKVAMHEIPVEARISDVPERLGPGMERYQVRIPPRQVEWSHIELNQKVQAMRVVKETPDVGFQAFPMQRLVNRSHGGLRLFKQMKMPPAPPLDAAHHVGPMTRYEVLITDPAQGVWDVDWENRGRGEYETRYDPPAPDVPITGTLLVKKYSVSLSQTAGQDIVARNDLAGITGSVELLDGVIRSRRLRGRGTRGIAATVAHVPQGTAIWRIGLESTPRPSSEVDVYVLYCADNIRCSTVRQQPLVREHATLSLVRPQAGSWRIILLQRRPGATGNTYKIQEAVLRRVEKPGQVASRVEFHPSGQHWRVPVSAALIKLPPNHAAYAAFRIVGDGQEEGNYIAVTPLRGGAP